MNINTLHFSSKPSYKLIHNSPESLDTAELLAIILGRGRKGQSVLQLSHKLLKDYNLHGLDSLSYYQLKNICGDHVHLI